MKTKLVPTIEDAIAFAALKHKGAKDRIGEPYILHPLSVMQRMKTETERIVAALHDVVEDCGVSIEELRALGYSEEVLEALSFVTKRPEELDDYPVFIGRIKNGPTLAIKVKLADLADNTDPNRRTVDGEATRARMEKYRQAIQVLEHELVLRGEF
ncbi:MAG: GTP pyrophosphokinase [Candidatus Paceibacterota bacterium]|jgi:(p)ppGpp synthase/HD superfamily hydrolase